MLDEEERDDTTLKERFGSKWKRTTSNELTQSIRGEVAKFQGIVESATKADLTVREKFETHCPAMVTLKKSETDPA
uniref:ALIX V-shaped domain-containing protein n=1 Tax=Amphimedon queenslandica TaxID=400682 RepID=A0A1X7TE99_AMPQE